MDGYEIRLEIIKVARDIVDQQNNRTNEEKSMRFYMEKDLFDSDKGSQPPEIPSFATYSASDVINEAKKLNDFVAFHKG